MDWQPIETAPKDGTVILVTPGCDVDDHTHTWPKGSGLDVVPARWCTSRGRDFEDGWYPPWYWRFATYDSVDYEMPKLGPEFWMPLPEPP